MSIAEQLLPEFDHEMGVTRRLLERVPEAWFEWKPQDKARSLGALVTHIIGIPGWIPQVVEKAHVEAGEAPPAPPPASRAEVLSRFDQHVKAGRAALAGRTDAELLAPWTLRAQGKEIFTLPKAAALRGFVISHLIHHRGQLSVYLRMQNVPIPSIYGPSGDESM